jgi:protein O-mannosyl-transferase
VRRDILIGFLLVAAVAVVYWRTHSYPFVELDDYTYVVNNPYVEDGLTAEGLAQAFTGSTGGNWHPLTMLSHMLDCQLFGVESGAGWHHTVNVALHAANTILLWIVLRRMTGAFWQSALVAALFGLHPLHVESVAWISERKDVLSTFFFMLVLLAYHHYSQRPTLPRYAAVFVLLALGLMSKPMLVTVPFVLLLLDYWPLDRIAFSKDGEPTNKLGKWPLKKLVVEKTPLLALATASATITYFVQHAGGAMGMLGQVPFETRLGNAVFIYGKYLEKAVWPVPLSALYSYVSRKPIDVWLIGAALVALSVAILRLARIRPFLCVGWGWYLGTLLPVIGLIQVGVQSMADRYTYIPLIGIFIIAVWGAAEITKDWPMRIKVAVALGVLAIDGWLAWRQVATWSSSEALFRHAVQVEPYNLFAMHALGTAYWKDGKLEEAQEQFEAILKTQRDNEDRDRGGLEPAERTLGLLMAVRDQPRAALEHLQEAMRLGPQQPEPPRHMAWILATSLDERVRDGKKAIELAEQALEKSDGKPPEYWDTLAAAQAEAGNFPAAVRAAERALEEARRTRSNDLIPGIEERLKRFRTGLPYRAPAQRPQRV